jgi:hypothetical protein
MNTRNPKLWAIIGFGVGSVIAAAGSIATPLDSLIGGIIQALIWYGVSSLIIKKNKRNISIANPLPRKVSSNIDLSNQEYVQAKVCDACNERVPLDYIKCFRCDGTSFTHKRVLPGDYVATSSPNLLPETKTCPMCAEEVKYAAKKCRFCQHMLDA